MNSALTASQGLTILRDLFITITYSYICHTHNLSLSTAENVKLLSFLLTVFQIHGLSPVFSDLTAPVSPIFILFLLIIQ